MDMQDAVLSTPSKISRRKARKFSSMSGNDRFFVKLLQNFILPPNIPRDTKDAVVTNPTETFRIEAGNFLLNVRE